MSSPEADNPQPLEDTGAAYRQENEKQRKSVIDKIDGINFRKTKLKPSITPRERAAMPLVDLVRAEYGLTQPEDIVLERMRDIYQLARGLQNAHTDPEDSEETDPLYQKIETALNPEDSNSVKNHLFYNISERLLFKAFRRTPHDVPKEEIEWENKWDEYFKKNPAVLERYRDQAIKENARFNLSSEIKSIASGVPVEEERLAYFLSDCKPTPADLKTDPLFQRLFEVCDRQGKDPEQILTHFNIEVQKRIGWDPHAPWLQEWSAFLSAPPVPTRQPSPAYDPFDTTSDPDDITLPPATPNRSPTGPSVVDIEETLEDSRAVEATREEASRKKALNHLEALFVAKTETFPGLPDEKYTDLSLFSVLAKMDRDSVPAGSPYEKLLKNYNQEITEIVNLLVEAKIRPEVQNPNDELYENLNLILSAQDKAQVMQRAMFNIYREVFGGFHDESDPDASWISTWRDFFTSDEQLVKQLKWQNTKLDGQTVMGIEISELRAGEHKSNEAIVNNLLRCYINPDQFDNHPFVGQLSDILGPGWSTVRLQYFQKFTHMRSSDLRRVDSYDMVINPYSRPESLSSAFYDSWINDPRVVELRAQQATGHQPETTPAVVTPEAPKTKWSDKITGLIVKSSKAIYEKVKSLNVKDAFLGKGGDVVMAGMIGAAVRGLASSDPSWGPTIALLSGGAFGAYHGFNREVNNRYQTTIAKKASTGDSDATTELDKLSKENILQKEKFLKKECWKRYKALPGKDKAAVVSYTLVGAFVGATVAEIGYLGMEDMYMHQDKSIIEDFFANSFYDIFNVPRPAGPGEFRGGLK